jgi:hypothetical protein
MTFQRILLIVSFFLLSFSIGNFVISQMEMAAAARAQAAGGQEFADFSSYLGVGTYPGQLAHIHLPDVDPELNVFEGGYVREIIICRYMFFCFFVFLILYMSYLILVLGD